MRSDRPVIWLATDNLHKLMEANAVLEKYHIPLRQLKVEKLELQSMKLEEVARYALGQLSSYTKNRFLIVEDSGLFINALDGFPGPFSSYVRKSLGLNGILKLLEDRRDRSAFFKAAVALAGPRVRTNVFTGTVQGSIASEPRGSGGFGFDPIFVPAGSNHTFAEEIEKFKISRSHRAKAMRRLAAWYLRRFP